MNPEQQAGQATVEYTVVCALAVLVLITADTDVAEQLLAAIKWRFEQFAVLMAAP